MGFNSKEAEDLLVATGRRCCICGTLHTVQLHHIVPVGQGGTDDIDNAITLCPNCHNEVHGGYAAGRSTKAYTDRELKLHRRRTIRQVKKVETWAPGSASWEEDKRLILFYAQCLDRPAFRTAFHQETSFSAFDQAMEDTLLALNTGYWRTRDGTLIERSKGNVHLVSPAWHSKVEQIVEAIEEIRRRFHQAAGLNRMLYEYDTRSDPYGCFREDRELGDWMDRQRQKSIEIMNSMLREIDHQPLRGLREWG